MSKIVEDPRIDPRIKAMMGAMPSAPQPDVSDRETLLAETNTPEGIAARERITQFMSLLDNVIR